MTNNFPNRTDSIYKKIELYNDYELIECITFEMAIRNNDVQNQFWKAYKYYIKLYPDIKENFLLSENEEIELQIKIDNIFKDLEEEYYIEQNDFQKICEEVLFDNIFNNNITGNEPKEILYRLSLQSIYEFFLDKKDSYNNTPKREIDSKREILLRLAKGSLFGGIGSSEIEENDRTKEFSDFTSYKNINVSTDIDPTNKKSVKKISISTSSPIMKVPDFYNKNVLLELNFNLPTKDILSKVKYMKKEYDKNNKLIPLDIEIIELNFNDNTKIKSIKRDKVKLADNFYMFDYFLMNSECKDKSAESIYIDIAFQEINDNTSRGISHTINTMKEYIHKLQYKQLLTGI